MAGTQHDRVIHMLDESGLTASDFSRKVGVTKATFSRWKTGERSISRSSAEKIHDVFPSFAVDWILGISDYQNQSEEQADQIRDSLLQSVMRADPMLRNAVTIASMCGYRIESKLSSAKTGLDAAVAYGTFISGDAILTVVRESDGTSFEVPLATVDEWASNVIEKATAALESIGGTPVPEAR